MNSSTLEMPQERLKRLFLHGFSVMDVVNPLISFDAEHSIMDLKERLEYSNHVIIGVREEGFVNGYVTLHDLMEADNEMSLEHITLPIRDEMVITDSASIPEMIKALKIDEPVFVTVLGQICAYAYREDMQKPAVRMWVFGVINIYEMNVTLAIDKLFPGGKWKEKISPARLEKAINLHQERLRRKQACSLLSCLQFADKMDLLLKIPNVIEYARLSSKREAIKLMKQMQSLRNDIAHAQQLTTEDFQMMYYYAHAIEHFLEARVLKKLISEKEEEDKKND